MSWPTDGEPRFVTGEITGQEITGVTGVSTEVYVYDRGHCCRVVQTFVANKSGRPPVDTRRRLARELAERLNAA